MSKELVRRNQSKLTYIHATVYGLLLCFVISQPAWALFWIEAFTGEQEEYRLIRQNKELQVETGMVLETGDELSVLSDTGELQVLQDDHEHENLFSFTRQNGLFKVPGPTAPSSEIRNTLALGKRLMMQPPEEKMSAKSMKARGDRPVLILGASDLKNYLIAGFDSLLIHWSGGEPPYRIRLLDDDDNIVIEKNNIQQNHITVTDLALPRGHYGLEVLGNSSSSYIALAVVEPDKAPPIYNKIIASQASAKVKERYAAMALAGQSQWLFQTLQLAERYGLSNLKQNILNGMVPDWDDATQSTINK